MESFTWLIKAIWEEYNFVGLFALTGWMSAYFIFRIYKGREELVKSEAKGRYDSIVSHYERIIEELKTLYLTDKLDWKSEKQILRLSSEKREESVNNVVSKSSEAILKVAEKMYALELIISHMARNHVSK